jgi:hypothetical protein
MVAICMYDHKILGHFIIYKSLRHHTLNCMIWYGSKVEASIGKTEQKELLREEDRRL